MLNNKRKCVIHEIIIYSPFFAGGGGQVGGVGWKEAKGFDNAAC